MTMKTAAQACPSEVASEPDDRSGTHHFAVVIHAGSAAAGVDANTGQVRQAALYSLRSAGESGPHANYGSVPFAQALFMHLRQAVEAALVVLADSCSKSDSGILISVVIVLAVHSRVRCRCVLFQDEGLNRSSIPSIIDAALLEAQSDLCSMISEVPAPPSSAERTSPRLRDGDL